MNDIILYMLKSSVSMALLYVAYSLFFKNTTYFQLNRFYLILSLFISLIIPLITIGKITVNEVAGSTDPATTSIETIYTPIVRAQFYMAEEVYPKLTFPFFLFIIYVAGVLIFLIKFIFQITRLFLFLMKGTEMTLQRYSVISTEGKYPTSSFFRYILWNNKASYSEADTDRIISHELIHIKQLHTLDNVLLELLKIVYWFNPFIYLYNKSIKQNHEYIADERVLKTNSNVEEYTALINKQILNNLGYQLSNNFNMSNLQKRVNMMTKSRSSLIALLNYVIAIPVTTVLILFFTFSLKTDVTAQNNSSGKFIETSGTYSGKNVYVKSPVREKNFSIKNIFVNDKVVMQDQKTDAFEINLKTLGFKKNDAVAIRIEYTSETKAAPVFINPEVLKGAASVSVKGELKKITLNGIYKDKNIYVTNFKNQDNTYCIKEIKVNDALVNNPATDSFEIDLGSKKLKNGDKVSIELFYYGIEPKILNPEAIATQ